MTSEVRGGPILKQVKARLRHIQDIYNQKQVTIIRFHPPEEERDPLKIAAHEAARFSTEHKVKTFGTLGCRVEQPVLDYQITLTAFRTLLTEAIDNSIGVIVQNPMPPELKKLVQRQIPYLKDLDGMRLDNPYFRTSATSETIFRLVESFAQKTDTVAVIGAGGFVGAGVVKLLKEAGIETIELDLGDDNTRTRKANIVVSATGQPNLLDERHIIPEHRLVVDAGFVPEEGKPIRGDVNRSTYGIPQYLTPVPGGVGPLQMATLLERLVSQENEIEIEYWIYPGPEADVGKRMSQEQAQTEIELEDELER